MGALIQLPHRQATRYSNCLTHPKNKSVSACDELNMSKRRGMLAADVNTNQVCQLLLPMSGTSGRPVKGASLRAIHLHSTFAITTAWFFQSSAGRGRVASVSWRTFIGLGMKTPILNIYVPDE